jgi:hypothetical protein
MGQSTTMPSCAVPPNDVWSYDSVHAGTIERRCLKGLMVLDEYTREGLPIYCSRSIIPDDVVHVLQRLLPQYGASDYVQSDNESEVIA